MQEYKVSEIIGMPQPANYGAQNFKVKFEAVKDTISLFSKYPIEVGNSLYGEITKNGQWYNFKFGKRENTQNSPQTKEFSATASELKNILSLRLEPKIDRIMVLLEAICEQKGVKLPKLDNYPEMDETNSAEEL